jgi:hypothetical protein
LKKIYRYKFVFLHRPPFPTTSGFNFSMDKYKTDRDALHKLFVENKVSAVFSGHEHLFSRSSKDGITYVISGGGGQSLLSFWSQDGAFFHYIIAKKANEGYLVRVHDISGNIKDQFSIK